MIHLVTAFVFTILVSSSEALDHDDWEFHGGRKIVHRHGLNTATKDAAPLRNGGVHYDDYQNDFKTEVVVTNDEATPAPLISGSALRDARRSLTAKQEELLLPDRFSVLNFESHDEEQHAATTDSSYWGRLFVEGFPGPMQYFRAHFGLSPPNGEVKLLLAQPLTMCDDVSGLTTLKNSDEVDTDTVIVAKRGSCTFAEKAIVAHEFGAAGILFVNNVEGNFHISGPEAHDIPMSASMIAGDDGSHLIQALMQLQNTSNMNYTLRGRYIPIMCGSDVKSSVSYCQPVQHDDETFVSSLNYHGKFSIDDREFDYLQGEFGSWIDSSQDWTTVVPSVIGGDEHCCEPEGFDDKTIGSNHAILCLRGECDFVSKAENVASSGAGMLVVSSHNNTLYRMGADPPHRGRKLSIPITMVGIDAYDHLVYATYEQLDKGMNFSIRVAPPYFSLYECKSSAETLQ